MFMSKSALLSLFAVMSLSACGQSAQLPAQRLNSPMMARSVQTAQNAQAARPRQPESAQQHFINEVASAFHEAWRAGRRKPDGSFEPRIKETKDAVWIKAHGSNQIDIANTRYADLPADWQAENKASAEISVQLVLSAKGAVLTPQFIEQGSHVIHVKWLERNSWAKGGELDKPYAELPEPEKQKDREALYQAINKGLELRLIAPAQVSAPVQQAVQQMLARIKK